MNTQNPETGQTQMELPLMRNQKEAQMIVQTPAPKPKIMEIDLETYSDVDLGKSGVYKYVEGDFHILLFSYCFDDDDVVCIDMARGQQLPDEVLAALEDPEICKIAWNASFERTCLSHYLGHRLDPRQWKCAMVWAASLSLPLSLAAAGMVLKTGEQKDRAGKDLIRYFSVPCKPTKTNGGRTRNMPEDAPEKWEQYVSYNLQDVRTERDIRKRLEKFPMPQSEWEAYWVDQNINDFGVRIDMDLVHSAIDIDHELSDQMNARAIEITGLENPNSVSQLRKWLDDRGIFMPSLGKKEVESTIKDLEKGSLDTEALEMLKLRQQMSKSSVKKYEAAERCVCADGRAHGLFQFNGANRTGRFCLTGDHEVLTPEGWVRLDAWSGGKIACWNSTSEAVSFQEAEQVHFDYNGPMYTYSDVRIDQTSTPDHKMWAQGSFNRGWKAMTVEEMSHYCAPVIPITGYRHRRDCVDPNWFRVLIMTQADGYYTADGQVVYSFKKQRKIERCKSLLRKAEIPFVVNEHKDRVTSIRIPSRAVPLWLREFKTKTFGYWMLDEDPNLLFDELPNWDGSKPAKNSIQYTTTIKQNADIIQALAHMSGRTCSMKIKHREDHPEWADAYVLNIWLTPGNHHVLHQKPVITDFEGIVYCAVTQTGYFLVRRNGRVWITGNSGRLLQLQNLKRNDLETLDEARELVKTENLDALKMIYGEEQVTDILSQLVRTMLIPRPGCEFIVADFSAIEARVLAWEAGEQWTLDAFRNGEDLYCAVASSMFGVPVEKHGINGELRQKGKIATLACGYQGGVGALKSMGALEMGLTEDELPDIIQNWRNANPHVVQYWWDVQQAAIDTIKDHKERTVQKLTFQFYAGTLWMVLPSGRKLAYLKPRLQPNENGYMSITFEGNSSTASETTGKWARQESYGGKLVENATQAIARDILVEAMKRLEGRGFHIVAHIHDECVVEVPIDEHHTVEEIAGIMSENPSWCPDLPLSAAGYRCLTYRKD